MGSVNFSSMVASLVVLSQGVTLMLSKSLLLLFDYERAYYNEYAVGFSGVLFAMKVVLNSEAEDYTFVHGVMVPSRYAAWAELLLVQLLVPGVSFIGHLGGILAGLLYLKLRRTYSGSNPMTVIVRGIVDVVKWPLRFLPRQGRITGRGRIGGGRAWRCQVCTYDNNNGLLSECEICGTSRGVRGVPSSQMRERSDGLPLDELRRRRLDRFGR